MITRSVLFSLKCTRRRLAGLSAPPDPLAVLGVWGPQEGREREGMKGKGGGEGEGKEGRVHPPNVH